MSPSLVDIQHEKRQRRQEMRAKRRALTAEQQHQAATCLTHHLSALREFAQSQHIGVYWPNDGEIDPRPLAARAWELGKCCYLPVLHPFEGRLLWFVRWESDTVLLPNRFGIPEPNAKQQPRLSARHLQMVLLPLVAFDRTGGRLGMGGGFYDRTFAFKRTALAHEGSDAGTEGAASGPTMIGLAHACQEAPEVIREPWDIPLDSVVTDQGRIG